MNSQKNFNSNTENKDEWFTPSYIIDALGRFDLDPCTSIDTKMERIARCNYSKDGTEGGTANAPSCLVAYGEKNVNVINTSNLKGKFVSLRIACPRRS